MNRISFRLVVVVGLVFPVLTAAPSWAQSHPTAETIRLFGQDYIRYPGLTIENLQPSLDAWQGMLEDRKQALADAQASGADNIAEAYRQDIADIEQRIADLNAGAAASQPAAGNGSANPAGQNPTDTGDGPTVPVAPVIPPDQNPPSASDNAASPTIGDLMNSPEAIEKRAQAKQLASEAVKLASAGQYSDVEDIKGLLVEVLGAARQLSLAGINDEASELETQAKKALTVFITAFANSCGGQSFDPLFALGLSQQSQALLNSDGGLAGCENRLLATVSGSGGWRHCGMGIGDWSYRDKFDETSNASGTGTILAEGGANKFSFQVTGPNADFKLEGRLEFQRNEFKMPGGRILSVVYRLIEHRDSASGRFGLSDAHIEAFPSERQWDVSVLNDNKPCDPSKDVWGY